jgi:hypothetical protein
MPSPRCMAHRASRFALIQATQNQSDQLADFVKATGVHRCAGALVVGYLLGKVT